MMRFPLPFAVAVLLVGLGLAFVGGCPAECQVMSDKIAACAAPAVAAEVGPLVNDAVVALQGGQPNWDAEVVKLEASGISIAICVIEAALGELFKAIHGQLGHAAMQARAVGRARGCTYLAAHGVKLPACGLAEPIDPAPGPTPATEPIALREH